VIIFPAIDLKDGRCVRLRQGDMAQATIFNDDPAAQACEFETAGFEYLHLVDLNGAFAGHSVNAPAIRAILSAIKIPLQLGGGIRDRDAIESWLTAGVTRVILGTVAVSNPALVAEAARAHPGRIAVGIDARNGKVAVKGWAEESTLSSLELAKRFEGAGVAAIIFTDIGRDGMMEGANVESTAALARAVSIPVIASGGVNSVQDIERLCNSDAAIAGVVIGRALYDGRVDPAQALMTARCQ
jgi:phosphoribosylformimino-5-aminoimidazole carboxamide ribotide isomerase